MAVPDAASPRNIGQQHHGEPAQPAGFDEVAVRGACRVAVDSTRLDLAAPSSFEGVIKTDDDGAIGNKGADQQPQQAAGDMPPARSLPEP